MEYPEVRGPSWSRPGRDLAPKTLQERIFLDLGPFLVDFGTQDHLIADILFGIEKPGGKLPIELPRSQEAANKQKEDIPYDSENPLYDFGHGLEY